MTNFKRSALSVLAALAVALPCNVVSAAFTETWDEAVPADHTKFSAQPGHVRDTRTAVRERFQHGGGYWPAGHDESAGEWTFTYYREQASDPGAVANVGKVYTKEVGGRTELHYIDDAGNVRQLTPGSSGLMLPSGAVFFMITGSCPTGSTDVSATYSDKFLRVNATAASTGGADTHSHTDGTYAAATHTHSVPMDGWGDSNGTAVSGRLITEADGNNHATADNTSGASGSIDVSGTSASSNNIPAYVTAKLCQVD